MPELPEVETIVRDLRPELVGRVLTRADVIRSSVLKFPDPGGFRAGAEGFQFRSVRRLGKFIHLGLSSGDDVVVHLGMSGSLTLRLPQEPLLPHTHLLLDLDDGRQLRYRDPRRFGRILLGRRRELQRLGALPKLGPDPLSSHFPEVGAVSALGRSARMVKSLLLDQRVIAGCGNIYADEACFVSRVRPDRRSHTLTWRQANRLLLALPLVMREALRRRGTSFSDYRDGFGAKGAGYQALFVYGRGGLPCARCGSTLRQTRVGGRTTVYCDRCQR